MRSSKSRSRSKSNRNRPSGGNIVNRVFDSSGPEGKVRGTPQQIIDKYNQLTRDAQLSGDRVAAENFAQHAEHYTRMLAEAQREMDQRREQNDQQNRDRQQSSGNADRDRDRQQGGQGAEREAQGNDQPETDQPQTEVAEPKPAESGDQPVAEPKKRGRPRKAQAPREDDVIDPRADGDGAESNLVDTPEGKPKPRRRSRAKAAPSDETKSEPEDGAAAGSESENQTVE